ncbi:hypothetical protein NQ314_021418 [Rhamnusium bicolor]|uniref:Uncharacterized protein n=1 Tax=Rhamnusium bicolor TaxID=1586634 RepID=A0AAV8WHI6_9CUCU|nr:hypothetical protein NQ314_021418 [Rhamnusium bicolor]
MYIWQNLKSRTKIKISTERRQMRATGGGTFKKYPLTNEEQDMLSIIKEVSVDGNVSIEESHCAIDLPTKSDVEPVSTR